MSNQKIIGVDVGNSAIKTAEFGDHGIEEIEKWKDLMSVIQRFPDSRFIISSVKQIDLSDFKDSLVLSHRTSVPLELDYKTPETLGADRIAAAVGAWNEFQGRNILIIDGGSCITYDIVTSDSQVTW